MFFLTLISHTRAPQIRRVILCQAAYFEKSRTRSTLIPKTAVFPRLTRLLCGAVKARIQSGELFSCGEVFPRFIGHYLMCPQHRNARRARSCIVVHFTCPLVALRIEGTFHVFANVLAKTFHFCAADIHSLTAHYICAKISRPERHGTLSLIDFAVPHRTPICLTVFHACARIR